MPIYDYACAGCGPFAAMQPMARFRDPRACPRCGAEASRAIGGAPALTGIGPTRGSERGAMLTGTDAARASPAAHPSGCGCCVRPVPLSRTLSERGRVFTSPGVFRRGG